MSINLNKRSSETECYNKVMNQSTHSSNTKDNSKKVRLRSNTIFAFQDDHIYSNIYTDENDEVQFNHLAQSTNDTFLIPHNNNLNNSNFFSTVCDRSQWFNLNNTTTEKNHENENDLNSSLGSIADEMEKNFGFLNEVDDDLNDAKLSLNEDISLMSEKSNTIYNNMNLSTPVNIKFRQMIESEDYRTTNLNTQHSFSSSLTNQNIVTSTGSSIILQDDKKQKLLTNPSYHAHKNCIKSVQASTNFQQNPQNPQNTNNNSESILLNQNQNENLHANSVDFTNQSPFRLSYNSMNNVGSNSNKYNTNTHNTNSKTNFNYNNFVTNLEYDPFMSHNNFYTPKNFISSNNPYNYSFCLDNNVYKNYLESQNRSNIYPNPNSNVNNFNTNMNKSFIHIPPVRFNPNEDKSVLDNLMILIKDQNGCRMIQRKLEEKKEEFLNKFFDKIKNNINEIICDQFGNYVIQKFIECCSDKNIITNLLEKIKPKIYSISTNCYGTRGFQRILDFISEEADYEIMKEYLSNNILNLIKDVNGNHVIQKVLQIYPTERNHFVLDEIIGNILEISKLKQGGCIFQKAIEKANEIDKLNLIGTIVYNVDKLINDEHGNFIVQHTINLKMDNYNEKIFEHVKSNFINLSKQKYSSNVIDKCALYEDSLITGCLIEKMLELKCVGELVMDQYGNYVIQKALQVSNGIKFLDIIEQIKKSIKTLKQTNYGKKIYDSLMTNYGEYFNISSQKGAKKTPNTISKKPTTHNNKKEKNVTCNISISHK